MRSRKGFEGSHKRHCSEIPVGSQCSSLPNFSKPLAARKVRHRSPGKCSKKACLTTLAVRRFSSDNSLPVGASAAQHETSSNNSPPPCARKAEQAGSNASVDTASSSELEFRHPEEALPRTETRNLGSGCLRSSDAEAIVDEQLRLDRKERALKDEKKKHEDFQGLPPVSQPTAVADVHGGGDTARLKSKSLESLDSGVWCSSSHSGFAMTAPVTSGGSKTSHSSSNSELMQEVRSVFCHLYL